MSAIEDLIYKFNGMCGESQTEMGTLAKKELHDLKKEIRYLKRQLMWARDAASDNFMKEDEE